jgi:hypothetical protein
MGGGVRGSLGAQPAASACFAGPRGESESEAAAVGKAEDERKLGFGRILVLIIYIYICEWSYAGH